MTCIDAPSLRELYFLDNYIAEMRTHMQALLLGQFMGGVQRFGTQFSHSRFSLFHLKDSSEARWQCV